MTRQKKAMLNTTIDENILNEFREYCKSINCPMNKVLEMFMAQFADGQFKMELRKTKQEG